MCGTATSERQWPLFSPVANNIVSSVENNDHSLSGPAVTADEARASLQVVSAVSSVAGWRPQRLAAAVSAVVYGAMITVASWGSIIGVVATGALFAVLIWLLRRRLWNPWVRERRRQDPFSGAGERDWLLVIWPLWMPMAIVVPATPPWVGLLAGGCAGVFAYLGLRRLGESSR